MLKLYRYREREFLDMTNMLIFFFHCAYLSQGREILKGRGRGTTAKLKLLVQKKGEFLDMSNMLFFLHCAYLSQGKEILKSRERGRTTESD